MNTIWRAWDNHSVTCNAKCLNAKSGMRDSYLGLCVTMSQSLLHFSESVWPAATARGRGRAGSFKAVVCELAAKSVCLPVRQHTEPFLLVSDEDSCITPTYC